MVFSVEGACDLHIHAGPELFRRIGDGAEIAARAREAGMRAVAFKCHHESTVGWAHYIRRMVPGIQVCGGIVLNDFVGGVNPEAVRAALQMGGRIVWGPTMHGAYHISIFGRGTYGIKSMTVEGGTEEKPGVTALDAAGNLSPQMREVLDLVARHKALFGTAHLSPEEIRAVLRYGRQVGARIVITHPFFLPRNVGIDYYVELARAGGILEICAVMAFPMAHYQEGGMTIQQARDLIEAAGPERCIVSTDSGQPFNPWPDEALRIFGQLLVDIGMDSDAVRMMMVDNPARLLELDAPVPAPS